MSPTYTSRFRTAVAGAAVLAFALSPVASAKTASNHIKHHRQAQVTHVANRTVNSRSSTTFSGMSTGLVWNGDLSTANLSQYGSVQACKGPSPTAGVTLVNSPVHPGYSFSSAFNVSDQSITANCPQLGSSGHPNANIQSPGIFYPGDNYYVGFSTLFPSTFPSNICTPYVSGCWMQIMEIYGAPYGGSSPVAFDVWGNKLELWTHYGTIWTAPTNIVKGAWQDLVVHVNFSTNPSVGYVELWWNGHPQVFNNGSTRYYEATLQVGVNTNGTSPDRLYLDQYRGANPARSTVTLYHSAAKVGTTYASAAP